MTLHELAQLELETYGNIIFSGPHFWHVGHVIQKLRNKNNHAEDLGTVVITDCATYEEASERKMWRARVCGRSRVRIPVRADHYHFKGVAE